MPNPATTMPQPPTQLWGLWAVTRKRPGGFWWNHTNGIRQHADTPMTFISRDDALATAAKERAENDMIAEWLGDDTRDVLTVALIGVAPADL